MYSAALPPKVPPTLFNFYLSASGFNEHGLILSTLSSGVDFGSTGIYDKQLLYACLKAL